MPQRYLPDGLERGAFWKAGPRGWEAWRVEVAGAERSGAPGALPVPDPGEEPASVHEGSQPDVDG